MVHSSWKPKRIPMSNKYLFTRLRCATEDRYFHIFNLSPFQQLYPPDQSVRYILIVKVGGIRLDAMEMGKSEIIILIPNICHSEIIFCRFQPGFIYRR